MGSSPDLIPHSSALDVKRDSLDQVSYLFRGKGLSDLEIFGALKALRNHNDEVQRATASALGSLSADSIDFSPDDVASIADAIQEGSVLELPNTQFAARVAEVLSEMKGEDWNIPAPFGAKPRVPFTYSWEPDYLPKK
jgi:hypothetical protein